MRTIIGSVYAFGVAGVLLAGSIAVLNASSAQRSAGTPQSGSGSLPRTSWDRKPDLTGVWQGQKLSPSAYGLADLERLYRPEARDKMKQLREPDDPVKQCGIVYTYPRAVTTGFPIEIVQRPDAILLLADHPHAFRYVTTDGRAHPPEFIPSYQGDSAGHWDGDTLVVDVADFNGKAWLAGAADHVAPGMTGGYLTTNTLHITERWRLVDQNTLEYQATVEDPGVLTAAWTTPKIVLKKAGMRKIGEGVCVPDTSPGHEPNRDPKR